MSWKERFQKKIIFTSPTSQVFEAYWRKSERTFNRKIGTFSYPDVNGTFTQDLKAGGFVYPINAWFVGENHDLLGKQFIEALFIERGVWIVNHPVWGIRKLQLLSATEGVDPTGFGNITRITTRWQESILTSESVTQQQQTESATQIIDDYVQISIDDFAEKVNTSTASLRQAIISTSSNIIEIVKTELTEIAKQDQDIFNLFTGIEAAFLNTIDQEFLDVVAMAGQVINYVLAPVQAITNIKTRIDVYSRLLANLLQITISTPTEENTNIILTAEISASAVVAASILSSISGQLDNRQDSIIVIESLTLQFEDLTNSFDDAQILYNSSPVDLQYISQAKTYQELFKALYAAVRSLLEDSTNLKIEKIISIDKPTSPLSVIINNYENLEDETLDFFISTNNLSGQNILLLPAGSEAVVYI